MIKKAPTEVKFAETSKMPGSNMGTLLFNWNGSTPITNYTVIQPPVINEKAFEQYKLSGYVLPDVGLSNSELLSGFKVVLADKYSYAFADNNGCFELTGLTNNSGEETIVISKDGYLTREIKNVVLLGNKEIGSKNQPISMWAGDVEIDGVRDSVINMMDVMEVANSFGRVQGDQLYKSDMDFNKDGSINLSDIMIIANHFNSSASSYNEVKVN